MRFQRFESRYQVRLEDGDRIVHPNTELWLSPESEPVIRVVEPETNMPLMQLPDRLAG
jgi:hypothetical protein